MSKNLITPQKPVIVVDVWVSKYTTQNMNADMLADFARVTSSKAHKSRYDFLKDCVCNLKRHQWHIRMPRFQNASYNAAKCLVKDGVDTTSYNDFEELYNAVRQSIQGVYGVGDCVIYECSLRLGHTMGLSPDKYVYIHARPKEALKALLGRNGQLKIRGNSFRVKRQELVQIFSSLCQLKSAEIEDLLCFIYDVLN